MIMQVFGSKREPIISIAPCFTALLKKNIEIKCVSKMQVDKKKFSPNSFLPYKEVVLWWLGMVSKHAILYFQSRCRTAFTPDTKGILIDICTN